MNSLQNTLTAIALLFAIAKLHCLVLASRRARRYGSPSNLTTNERYFRFDGWVPSRIQNFPRLDMFNQPHRDFAPANKIARKFLEDTRPATRQTGNAQRSKGPA